MWKTLGLLLAVATVVGIAGLTTAHAAPDGPGKKREGERPSLVAIVFGSLRESDGDRSVVDLRAVIRDGAARGNLRFYSPDTGYYSGRVRTLSVQNGVIRASGAGPLLRPDGQRMPVRYEAEITEGTKHVTIRVQGREGVHYTLDGALDPGFVKAGAPPAPEKGKAS